MSIQMVAIFVALLYPALLGWDVKNQLRPKEGGQNFRQLSENVPLFIPFIALYYHDFFWQALIYYVAPLFAYCYLLAWAVQRWKKVDSPVELLFVAAVGGNILVIVLYYLIFHTGSAAPDVTAQQADTHSWWIWWPFGVIGLASVLVAQLNSEKMLLGLASVLLLAPYFSHHPLWAMLAAIAAFLWVCFSLAQKQGNSAYVAAFYFYMLAQFGSLAMWAIFF